MLLMDLYFFLSIVILAIGFTLLRKLRFHQDRKENNSSSPPSSSSLSSSLSLSSPPSPSSPSFLPSPQSCSSQNWDHNIFPSFHGPDVRKAFLSHLLEKFKNKGIELFIDNEIKRGKSIGPELKWAIRGSKIAIVLLSKNYASSSWCLDELVEIMTCRDLGQTVMTIFYKVDPTDVKKQTGDFGKAFRNTCQGKSKEKIQTWRKALEDVATIAGYDSKNCDNEVAMIEEICANVSKMLNNLVPSCDFERYIGMGAHIAKMKPLLRMDSDEVRMIGIWGPPGIGKTTIARFLFNKLSNSFQVKANMVKIKECYARACLDEYNAQLQLQNHMLSQVLNQKDMVISHLGVAQERLKEKKVLLVLDDVDRVAQLDALAEDICWFGPGSRIIIVTEDVRVLRAHGINHIYTVDFPSDDEALKMFCMYAFGQKYPKDGFRELAWEIVSHAGKLPLGLKVMGSYFRKMSKQNWKKALPKLWSSLDGEIESILRFSYDALDYDDKFLFLHIACFFVNEKTERVIEYLAKSFPYLSQGLDVLAEKSLIFTQDGWVWMHDLLVKLGREIVRKQSIVDPGQRQFLVDNREISEILDDDGSGSGEVISIMYNSSGSELTINERAFEGMSNLLFLKIKGEALHLPHGLSYLSPRLRLLDWDHFPATCLPSNVNLKFLVELNMRQSKLEKLWEGSQPLQNLKWMDLSDSIYLKELPDLSTATNLQKLDLRGCSSLGKLSSIRNATSLIELKLNRCSSLIELHSSIGSAINLQKLDLSMCTSLVELPSSIGNLHQLKDLIMEGCTKLEVLPVNVNLKSLDELDLSDCSLLKRFPEISTNIRYLYLNRTAIEKVSSSIKSWPFLDELHLSHCKNLKEFAHDLDGITERDTNIQEFSPLVHGFPRLRRLIRKGCKDLKNFAHGLDNITERDTKIQEVSPLVQGFPCLRRLILNGCKELLSLTQVPDSLELLDADNCESLEYCSFRNPEFHLNFRNCFKLNQEARDLIIQTPRPNRISTVLPGKEIPTYFSYRANGDSLIVKLNERPFPSSLKFKACILLVSKNEIEDNDLTYVDCEIMDKQNSLDVQCSGHYQR